MKSNEFEKLPKEAQERIKIRNNCSDMLPSCDAEKVDLLLRLIEEEYTGYFPSDEVLAKWTLNYSRISMMISIVRDYTFKVREGLDTVDDWISDGNKADNWGGGYKNG